MLGFPIHLLFKTSKRVPPTEFLTCFLIRHSDTALQVDKKDEIDYLVATFGPYSHRDEAGGWTREVAAEEGGKFCALVHFLVNRAKNAYSLPFALCVGSRH